MTSLFDLSGKTAIVTGATGALLIGLPPLWGLVLLTVLAGILMNRPALTLRTVGVAAAAAAPAAAERRVVQQSVVDTGLLPAAAPPGPPEPAKLRQRSTSGRTRWLETMIETAIVSTITMAVAAEKPPTKYRCPSPCGKR